MKLANLDDMDPSGGISLALMGMSGVGKTHLSNILRRSGEWYHYSVDYRLGRQYLTPRINDDLRSHAMADPMFARLLRADAMGLHAKVSIGNLDILTEYLGQVGSEHKGGKSRETFLARQNIHADAEIAATNDACDFLDRARSQYGYPNFVCDCSGSFCSIVDPNDAEDPVLSRLAARHIILYIDITEGDVARLIARFKQQPKPIFYSEPFFKECETLYLENGQSWADVDPDHFATWAFERIVSYRLPRYRAIADAWGYRVPATRFDGVKTAEQCTGILKQIITNS